MVAVRPRDGKSSSSSGVRGRLDEVAEVLDETEGPGVGGGEEAMGGGVTERDRCRVAMLIVGRACQKDEVEGTATEALVDARGAATGRLGTGGAAGGALTVGTTTTGFSGTFAGALPRFLSFSRSFLSFLRVFLSSSSSAFSTAAYMGTPLRTLVSTSRVGRVSNEPAQTEVAVRRRL